MLEAVRRWVTRGQSLPAWPELSRWAQSQGWSPRRSLSHDGWVMDRNAAHPRWRIEWGPSQRAFMSSHEFRIRVELAASVNVQALVLDRPLLARLDREVYQQITDRVRTRLDDETPEEMRWLAMHTKLSPNEMGVALRDRYGGLSDDPPWLVRWLASPVVPALEELAAVTPIEAVAAEPFMLRISRTRLMLRQAAPAPRVPVLAACIGVAQAAEQACARTGGRR